METISTRAFALICLALLAGCTSKQNLGSDPSGDTCASLRSCCTTLTGQPRQVCLGQVDEAEKAIKAGAPSNTCSTLAMQYAASGLCASKADAGHEHDGGALHRPDGGDLTSGDAATGNAPDICARYVSCVTKSTPAGAAAVLAAYGENGTCWQSTAQVAADCVTACRTGIEQLHRPGDGVCQECLSNAECSGATPVCDIPGGECVQCAANTDCGSGACDTSTHQCVECISNDNCKVAGRPVCDVAMHQCKEGCVSNDQCSAPNPACDLSNNYCVECVTNKDCEGSEYGPECTNSFNQGPRCGCSLFSAACPHNGICPAKDFGETAFCCVPECADSTCGAPTNNCGTTLTDFCGKCEKGGSCQGGQCDSNNKTCTPGADDCYPNEHCYFNFNSKQHECGDGSVIGQECTPSVDPCNYLAGFSDNSTHFICNNKCTPLCVSAADCPNNGECKPYWDANTITIYSPGLCVLP